MGYKLKATIQLHSHEAVRIYIHGYARNLFCTYVFLYVYTLTAMDKLEHGYTHRRLHLMPSVRKATGANRKNDIAVMIEKRLMLSRDSCSREQKKWIRNQRKLYTMMIMKKKRSQYKSINK